MAGHRSSGPTTGRYQPGNAVKAFIAPEAARLLPADTREMAPSDEDAAAPEDPGRTKTAKDTGTSKDTETSADTASQLA